MTPKIMISKGSLTCLFHGAPRLPEPPNKFKEPESVWGAAVVEVRAIRPSANTSGSQELDQVLGGGQAQVWEFLRETFQGFAAGREGWPSAWIS